MVPIVTIRNLKDYVGQEVTLQGWLYNKTGKGKLQFLQVRDGAGVCQAVITGGIGAEVVAVADEDEETPGI